MKTHIYQQFVDTRKKELMYRTLDTGDSDKKITANTVINFASNDYLGLSKNLDLLQAGYDAAQKHGVGSGASRFVTGNQDFFMETEYKLAHFKKKESAFFGVSGYQINLSIIPSLLKNDLFDKPPLVIFDKFNHASMYQGVLLSGAELIRFKHNDFNHLADILKKYASSKRQIFIMIESVYSMDGDVCDLKILSTLAKTYNAITLVDDAHATGIMGSHGSGLASEYPEIDIIIGTASKALGIQGGYVACSKAFMDYFYNSAGGFIYSTAVSPFLWGALNKVLDLLPDMDAIRHDVHNKAHYLCKKLCEINISTLQSTTHIVPAIFKDNETVLRMEAMLYKNGFITKAIRSPTVPIHLPRLRLTVNPAIDIDTIDNLVKIIKDNL
jgi:8-amino-7-oxononanoate synthase